MRLWLLCTLAALALTALPRSADAKIATLSIDFGSEWIKVGIVKPGVPMDIVLNRESKRKTPNVVAIRNGERTFGANALNTATKYPATGFRYLLDILGQQVDSPLVQRYKEMFPEHTIEADPERNTVVFRLQDGTAYSVEELVAMILQHVVELGSEYAEQPITSVVIAIPPFFSQPERHALLMAAQLADVQVTRLVSSPVAIGLNYGVFRRSEFNSTAQNMLFFDMGSSSTVASVVAFSMVKDKETKKKTPQLEVKGIGFDRTLGGFELDLRLRDHLLAEFKKAKAAQLKGDPAKSPRAMAKLLKEAQKVKTVLSANTETFAQVEGVFEDLDFRVQVTRATLETLGADLLQRADKPALAALQSANITMADIRSLIIIGGAVRIPKVQDVLLGLTGGVELGKNLNGDEACALGAAYEAAALSKAFRVKKFIAKDANVYPIEVSYNRTYEDEEGESKMKTVVRSIFPVNNPIPQKKILSLTRYTDDFSFSVNYGDLSFLDDAQAAAFGARNITTVNVRGVAQAFADNEGNTPKGIKVHFRLDDSGLFSIEKIEANFEKQPEEQPEEEEREEEQEQAQGAETDTAQASDEATSTASTGAEDEEKQQAEESEDSENAADDNADQPADEASQEGTDGEEQKQQQGDDGEQTPEQDSEGSADDGTAEDKKEDNEGKKQKKSKKGKKEKKPAGPKTVRVPLEFEVERHDIAEASQETLEDGARKLETFQQAERERRRNEESRNSLESFIYMTKEKLWDDDVIECSTEEEREKLSEDLSETSDWLDFEADEATAADFNAKLQALNTTAKVIFARVYERAERPAAVARLRESINRTRLFVETVRNFTANKTEDTPEWISEKELNELETLANSTEDWLTKKAEQQQDLQLHEDAVLKVSAVNSKAQKLDRELYYLFKRPQPKPKPKSKAKAQKEDTEGDDEAATASADDVEEEQETVADGAEVDDEVGADASAAGDADVEDQGDESSDTDQDQAEDMKKDEL